MKVSDYTYELPEDQIALHPPKTRGASRLLVLDKGSGHLQHRLYAELDQFLSDGDLLVLNDTKVIKARLMASNQKNQSRELLLLEGHHTIDALTRKVLYKGKIHEGEKLTVGDATVTVNEILGGGIAVISSKVPLLELAERVGSVPLPPYIHRAATKEDIDRYQTVFAKEIGSVAAPTASLNFTKDLEARLIKKGVQIAYLTLHVGLGTFLPIRSDDVAEHVMHSEYFEIPVETAKQIHATKQSGRKVFALGTTVARTLEYAHKELLGNASKSIVGEADIFIYPSYKFKITDGLITNFHAPKSTVLMLAAAFAGWDNLTAAYDEAIKENYAFLSYGDSMLIT